MQSLHIKIHIQSRKGVYLSINEQRCQYKIAFRDSSWHTATAAVHVVQHLWWGWIGVSLTLWLHGYTNFIGGRGRWKVLLLSALTIEPWSTELLSPVLFYFA